MKLNLSWIVLGIFLLILSSIIFVNTNATKDFKEKNDNDFSKYKIEDLEITGVVTWLDHTKGPTNYYIKTAQGQAVELPNKIGEQFVSLDQYKTKNVVAKGKGYFTETNGVKEFFLEQLLSIELRDSFVNGVKKSEEKKP